MKILSLHRVGVRGDARGRATAVPAPVPTQVSRVTRAKLMVLLPLTMALLVGATGFFAMNMTAREFVLRGPAASTTGMAIQLALISAIAAILGLGIALSVTAPLRDVAAKLEAIASGDLRSAVELKSTSEFDSLAGAFNDAISALNRYVLHSMTGAVITLNEKGIVIGSSPAAEALLGYEEDELVGKRFSEVFAPAQGGRAALAAIETAITQRRPVTIEEALIAAKDGRSLRIGISVSYLRDSGRPGSDKETIGVTIGFKDLTEIRRLRERLQQADQLVALGTLTAGVAHELRNPLASMRGLVELLGRDFEGADYRGRYVSTILEALDRLNRLVEDLLLFSSPSAVVAEEVDVDAVVGETVKFIRLGIGDKPVALVTQGTSGGACVNGSRDRLGRALSNVLLNAVQATPEGGTVTVTTSVSDARVAVKVHNTGSYIPTERLRQLFVPFFTTKPTGTGLGLAIANQIATAHGGQIRAESERAAGTAFTMELPVTNRRPAVVERAAGRMIGQRVS